MLNGKEFISQIGFYSPLIEGIIVFYCLLSQIPYLKGYLVFLLTNDMINQIIKSIIRQPRPINGKNILDNTIIESYKDDKYGMPSRHTQGIFFSLTYLYLVNENPVFLLIGLFLATACIYQRYTYRRHTMEQLIIGSFVGFVVGYISYLITNRYMHTQ